MIKRLFTAFVALALLTIGAASAAAATPASGHRPVLGSSKLFQLYGIGWGTVRPKEIYNGGDPNGDVTHITWHHWGSATAQGNGLGNQFEPNGGYYPKPVKVQLRAYHLGHCGPHSRLAYTKLRVRFQTKPGSSHWDHWVPWAGLSTICD